MSILTLSPERALRKEFIENFVIKKMNPDLYFKDLFPIVDLGGSSSFMYYKDETTAADDIKKGVMSEPVVMSELGELSNIEVSSIGKELGDTYQFGYKLQFSEQKLRENGFIDEVIRAYERAAWGLSYKINNDILNNMVTFAAADPATITDTWDVSNKINDDLVEMEKNFRVEGYNYRLTDLFLNKENFFEAKKWFNNVDGSFDPNNVDGLTMKEVAEDVEEGTLIGMDKNVRPLTIYKNTYDKYSTVNGSFINVNKYQEEGYPFKTTIELFAEMGIACKHPKAILKQTGI
ncbi:hypothetical protein [Methanobrevibacter sp. DSM 116169]|uniref:hypothetical protein n=1 Tax=Methanobrevibacter sp. DSM 116169 TaxID=3242727 RepID=UPI0038FC11AD